MIGNSAPSKEPVSGVTGVNHVGVTVSALDPAISFLSAYLGTAPTLRRIYEDSYIAEVTGVTDARIDVAYFDLERRVRLELLHYTNTVRDIPMDSAVPSTSHISLVVHDIAVAWIRAIEMGAIPVAEAVTTITSGPNAGGKMAYLRAPGDLLIELFQPADSGQTSGGSMRMKLESKRPWKAGYSRAVRVGNVIEVSGTVASDEKGNPLHVGDLKAQVATCIEVIGHAIDELGGSLRDVVRTRLFIRDLSRWEEAAEAHYQAFAGIEPACSFLGVHALLNDDFLVEIEATAIIED